MKIEQHRIEPIGQKKFNLSRHTVNIIEGSNPIPIRTETSKSRLFDRLNTALLGNYREVFDAWDPAESKIFTYLKIAYDRIGLGKKNKQEPVLLQLIPIDRNQESDFIDIKHLECRDGQI